MYLILDQLKTAFEIGKGPMKRVANFWNWFGEVGLKQRAIAFCPASKWTPGSNVELQPSYREWW